MSCGCAGSIPSIAGGGAKQELIYLPEKCKCADGRIRRVFRIKGKGNTLYVMNKGVVTKKSDIKK